MYKRLIVAHIAYLANFATFPCKSGTKFPAIKRGFKNAIFGNDVSKLFQRGYNVAIACEKSGIFVLDPDVDVEKGKNGLAELEQFEQKLGQLPKGFTVETPRGGRHLYFSPKGIHRPIGKIGTSIDCKFNGYVLAPESKIKGKYYKVIDGVNSDGSPILPELPETWLDFINKPNYSKKKSNKNFKSTFHLRNKLKDEKFMQIYNLCPFIQMCVDCAATLGEPEWHLFARFMNGFDNGLELFDYYSQPYPEYNREKTLKKFKNAGQYPISCDNVSEIFAGCKTCERGEINDK